jgi:hypothetical protein
VLGRTDGTGRGVELQQKVVNDEDRGVGQWQRRTSRRRPNDSESFPKGFSIMTRVQPHCVGGRVGEMGG